MQCPAHYALEDPSNPYSTSIAPATRDFTPPNPRFQSTVLLPQSTTVLHRPNRSDPQHVRTQFNVLICAPFLGINDSGLHRAARDEIVNVDRSAVLETALAGLFVMEPMRATIGLLSDGLEPQDPKTGVGYGVE